MFLCPPESERGGRKICVGIRIFLPGCDIAGLRVLSMNRGLVLGILAIQTRV